MRRKAVGCVTQLPDRADERESLPTDRHSQSPLAVCRRRGGLPVNFLPKCPCRFQIRRKHRQIDVGVCSWIVLLPRRTSRRDRRI